MKRIIALTLIVLMACALLVSCGGKDESTLVVGASSTPHAKILEQCVEAMKEKGFTLDIRVMGDYITPNTATEDGDIDANYFQHTPYLDQFNEENKTHLISVCKVHYEPFGIYAGKTTDLAQLPDGAVVAVPNDATNEARALQLLAAQGLITLPENAGLTVTKKDIVNNPKNLDIREMEAALLPTVLSDVNIAVINGNYAMDAGLLVANALATEDAASEAAQTFANILVVREGNENNPAVQALIEVLQSEAIAQYINDTFDGAVVSMN